MKKGRVMLICKKRKIRNRAVSLFVSAAMISSIFMPAFPSLPVFAAEVEQVGESTEAVADRLEEAVEGLAQSAEGMEEGLVQPDGDRPAKDAADDIAQPAEALEPSSEAQPQAEGEKALDLERFELYGAEDGNIARAAKAEAVYSNTYAGPPGKVNDGAFATGSGGTVWNTWGTTYGTAENPVWVQYTWEQPHVIESARVMWWIYTDGGVVWPRSAFMQYKKGGEWVNCGVVGVNGNSASYTGPGGAEANRPPYPSRWGENTVWNPVVMDEVIVTTQLRLCVVAEKESGGAPGIGVSEWEVFGYVDPALADLAEIEEDFLMELYGDVELPATGANGSTITWSNPTNTALSADGKVTRPEIGQEDVEGTITATAVKGDFTATKDFHFLVKAKMSDKAMAEADLAEIDLGKTEGRIENFTLPATGKFKSDITWSSSDTTYLWDDGNVVRPPMGASDVEVILTATAALGSATVQRAWTVTIPAYPAAGRSIVSYDPINVSCPQGNAPKLPNLVKVHYSDGNSELRRVMWEGYTVEEQKTQAEYPLGHKYEMNGYVQGDNATIKGYKVIADITVVAAEENNKVPSNVPKAEALKLSKVTLDDDPDGEQNRLTLNTEKHIQYILGVDITRMLYNYRWTFGLSTEGYNAPGGWDSLQTKLRGHGYGHYLSGLALAYASDTKADERSQLLARMKRMTDEMREMQEMTFVKIRDENGQERFREARDRYSTDEEVKGMTNVRLLDTSTAPTDPALFGYGYINAIQPEHLILIENYAPYNGNMSNYGVWAPYYALHKQLAGLVEIFNVLDGGNEEEQAVADKALAIAKDMGGWVWNRLHYCTKPGKRPDANSPGYRDTMWGIYIAGEYGGMNETLARLSDIMKKQGRQEDSQKLLEASTFFDNNGSSSDTGGIPFFESLAHNRDSIRTLHGNQHIPQIVGSLWAFKGSNDPKYYNIAENFWDYVFGRYAFTIGGVGGNDGNEEKFAGTYNQVGVVNTNESGKICETCSAYNLLKLTKDLNTYNPDDAKYMDYYERLLYNQIVGSIEPGSKANRTSYGYSIYPNTQRSRSTGNAQNPGNSCCSGTGTENHVKYQEAAYFTSADNKTFYVGLYIPTTARWDGQDVTIQQSCVFPSEESTFKVTVGQKSGNFEMKFRVPYWATKEFDIKLNGESIADSYEPSSYVSTGVRKWSSTDTVVVTMPFGFNVDYLPGKCDGEWYGSLMDGPLVMAATDVKSLSRVELDSYMSTGEGTNVIMNGRTTMTGGVRDEAPTRNVHNMSVQVAPGTAGGEASTKTFIPHYFAGIPAYTTYFYIPAPDENTGADKTPLFDKIAEASGRIASGLYTKESTDALQEVLKETVSVYQSEEVMESDLEAAIAKIEAGVQKLEANTVDLARLSEKLTEAGKRKEEDYTPETFAKLSQAVAAADAYVKGTGHTDKLTADHIFAIDFAISGLVELEREVLEAILDRASLLRNPKNNGEKLWAEHEFTVYTRKSWNAFKEKEESARKIYWNDPKVPTQKEIDDAVDGLGKSIDALLPYNLCDEREVLKEALERAKSFKNDPLKYDTESFEALQQAIEVGEDRLDYASLTFPERDGYVSDIEKAIQNLEAVDVIREATKIAEEAQKAADAAKDAEESAQADASKAQEEADKAAGSAAAAQEESVKAAAEASKAQQEAEKAAAEAGKSETAKAAAEAAKGKALEAQGNAEAAQDKAEQAQAKAETAQGKAEEAQRAAETAKEQAKTALEKAEQAQNKAETALDKAKEVQSAAERAIVQAEAAKDAVVGAKDDAVAAKAAAEDARNKAVAEKEAALAAAREAEAAKGEAAAIKGEVDKLKTQVESVKDQATAARVEAETAKLEAVAAKKEAEAARAEAISAKADAIVAQAAAEAAEKAAKEYAEIAVKAQAEAARAAAEAAEKEKAAEKARLAAVKAQKKAEAIAKKLEKDFNAFTLSQRAVTVKSAKKASKNKVKVILKKDKMAQAYQVQCSTKKSFKGSKSTKIAKSTSCTFGSLKKNTYYIRVRAFTKDSKGRRVYGKWSKVKKVSMK